MPDELLPLHKAPQQERTRRTAGVLLKGWAVWRKGELSIIHAVREAGGKNFAIAEFGLRQLRRTLFELDLDAWERHPNRTRGDVRRLFKKTIGRLGPHRGGWIVAESRNGRRGYAVESENPRPTPRPRPRSA